MCYTTKISTVKKHLLFYIDIEYDLVFFFRISSYFHQRKHRTYYITATKKLNQTDSDLYINDLDLTSRLPSTTSIDRDKRAYLKILERSVRTGRKIQDEKENNNNNKTGTNSNSNSFYFLRHYINKHLSSSSTTTNIRRSTEI